MSQDASSRSGRLRLVGTGGASTPAHLTAGVAGRVARENLEAAHARLDPSDPRWVLATRVRAELQGAVLTPERRDRLMRTAKVMGVGPFDASVIIAIVQDQVRRGSAIQDAAPLLQMLPVVRARRPKWMIWAAATLTAVIVDLALVWWILS